MIPIIIVMLMLLQSGGTNQTLVNPNPGDARSNQFEDPKGASWRVFAVDSYPEGPIGIVEVQEVRQYNPPSTWGVYLHNRARMPVTSFTVAAAIVSGDGSVKAVQPVPAIKNLQPDQVQRREIRVTRTVLMPTDRVVFFLSDISDDAGTWKADQAKVSAMIKEVANRLRVP